MMGVCGYGVGVCGCTVHMHPYTNGSIDQHIHTYTYTTNKPYHHHAPVTEMAPRRPRRATSETLALPE
jgi:hypothetical protein